MIVRKLYYIDNNVTLYESMRFCSSEQITDLILKEKYNIDRTCTLLNYDRVSEHTDNVIGYYKVKYKSSNHKLYAIKCPTCSRNQLLHGEGIYLVNMSHYKNGIFPCECAKKFNRTPYQNYLRIVEECKRREYIFLGYSKKHLRLYCKKHGYWETTTISHFFSKRGCPKCGDDTAACVREKPENLHISVFLEASNGNLKNFKRVDKRDGEGRRRFWQYECKICSHDEYVQNNLCTGVFTSFNSDLVKGKMACRCADNYRWTQPQREFQIIKYLKNKHPHVTFSGWVDSYKNTSSKAILLCNIHGIYYQKVNYILNNTCGCPSCAGMNQTECYINVIYDNIPIAIKYGISTKTSSRVSTQNTKSVFQVANLGIWDFELPYYCKSAENECKCTFNRVLTEREMPDGYTETAELKYIDSIINIFESWGGIRRK